MTDHAALFLDEYRAAALKAAGLKTKCEHAKELRKTAYARAVLAAGDVAVAKAEHIAMTSEEYLAAVNVAQEACTAAAEAEAELDYLNKRWEKWRTQMASARVKQQIEGER